jgi:hypothetical protein
MGADMSFVRVVLTDRLGYNRTPVESDVMGDTADNRAYTDLALPRATQILLRILLWQAETIISIDELEENTSAYLLAA